MIKVIGITGSRSEYDIIYPVLKSMRADKDLEVSVIVCGSHLSDQFGYTFTEIKKDGFLIADRIHNLVDSDLEVGKAKGAGLLLTALSESLDRIRPDSVMVVGDREESIVAGIACTYLGIPLIHLCGGDRTDPKAGDVDEPIRHATSKLASLHFTMNEEHRQRLLKMGEEPWRIVNAGDPALDRFQEIPRMAPKQVLKYFGFDVNSKRPLVLVIQHVISGEVNEGARQMDITLKAVTSLEANCIINYPNSDMGSRAMVRVIDKYKDLPHVRVTRHIPRHEFVNLLRNIHLLVGNSSLALLEGSFLKIPAINVGERNLTRMNAGNVLFVGHKEQRIRQTAEKILSDREFSARLRRCPSVYGRGNASRKILGYLKKLRRTRAQLLAKRITY